MKFQRGGFLMGMVVGLIAGLAVALGVALYVTKVPIPFVNKVPQRTAEQDAAEAERNKNWDPNAPLHGKNPARPGATPPTVTQPPTQPPVAGADPGAAQTSPVAIAPPAAREAAVPPKRDPADILADRPIARAPAALPGSTKAAIDPFNYFVQAGAFTRAEDAEQQRARLAMLGFGAKVSEREQSGRTVYRVRVGPFENKGEADAAKERLDQSGVDSSLVRVQK